MMNEPDVFDSKLLERLTRPLVQPGVIKTQMARGIILRSQVFANRLPLMAIAHRYGNIMESQTEQMPIVYAQRLLSKTEGAGDVSLPADAKAKNPQGEGSKTTVIQAKFASPTPRNSLTVNPEPKSVISENSPNSLPLVSLLPPNSPGNRLAAESLPIVYPQPLSPETRVSDISLSAKEGETRASQIDKNLDNTLTPHFHKEGWGDKNSSNFPVSLSNQPNSGAESLPIVYPQPLSPETRLSDISLPAKESKTKASQIDQNLDNNLTPPFHKEGWGGKNSSKVSLSNQPNSGFDKNVDNTLTPPFHKEGWGDKNSSNFPVSLSNQPNSEAESLPIVYPQPLSPETRLSDISLPAKESKTKLIQAKFTSTTANPKQQPQNPINSLPTAKPLSLQSISIPIVDAKPIKTPPHYQPDKLPSAEIPIIYPKSRRDERENKPTAKTIATETIQPPIQPPPLPKLIVRDTNNHATKVNTPLVFAHPSVTPSQTSPEMPNRGRETNPEIAPVTPQSYPIPNLRSQIPVNPYQEAIPQIDIDSLAAKVERKLMRKLIVENERRGGKL